METPPSALPNKGLGPLAWIGIGCGGIILLIVIAVVVFGMFFGPKLKEFAKEMEKNPARATANAMTTMSAGQIELIAEDDVNKRYTVREKQSGKLTTIYWSKKKKAPELVEGDFSAIPPEDVSAPSETAPPPVPK